MSEVCLFFIPYTFLHNCCSYQLIFPFITLHSYIDYIILTSRSFHATGDISSHCSGAYNQWHFRHSVYFCIKNISMNGISSWFRLWDSGGSLSTNLCIGKFAVGVIHHQSMEMRKEIVCGQYPIWLAIVQWTDATIENTSPFLAFIAIGIHSITKRVLQDCSRSRVLICCKIGPCFILVFF